ncbi:MAG: ATP-binding protein [Parvularculales bacterium]
MPKSDSDIPALLARIATALEHRLTPTGPSIVSDKVNAFIWDADKNSLEPVFHVNGVAIDMLQGIDYAIEQLLTNTRRFARGLPANNALLWGARGMGKSSLVKAVWGALVEEQDGILSLVEIHREDIESLPRLMTTLQSSSQRFIVFCDDLSFDKGDTSYKSLKTVLEGGLEGRPDNVVFYATSNRRHMMPREMIENEQSTAINPSEAVEESISLSDRFGLWLGFHSCNQDDYLAMIDNYAHRYKLDTSDIREKSLAWAVGRGDRSGRVAWQFIQDLAGSQGVHLKSKSWVQPGQK